MRDGDPDRSVLDRLDARYYGDPADERPAGVAPPCDRCGGRESVEQVDGRDLCSECIDDVEEDETDE